MALAKRYEARQQWLACISERSLDADFVRAVRDGRDLALDEIVRRPRAGVIELRLFSPEYTQSLLRELHAFEHWCTRHQLLPTRPNSMNNHGVVLDELGLDVAMDELLNDWLVPITHRYFPAHDGDRLDYQHAFVVDYCEAGDTSLGFHVDDSEVTLNACLGFDFDGSEVYFQGERCNAHRDEPANDGEAWEWSPQPGLAILHAGAHRHGVRPLRAGRRVNLIMWARSSKHRRNHPAAHAAPAVWCPSCRAA